MTLAEMTRAHARKTLSILARSYPDAHCALHYDNPWQLLVATILSAQCTDRQVNLVTPELFSRYPNPVAMAQADQEAVETLIRSTGFFRNKAKNLIACARSALLWR
jgi:endonuclease III